MDRLGLGAEAHVHVLAPVPRGAGDEVLGGHAVIITAAHAEAGEGEPGTLWHEGKSLGIYTSKGVLMLDRLKPAGKGDMPVAAFLAGYAEDL